MLSFRILFWDLAVSLDGCGCKDCKRVREHVASLLPFKVLEAAEAQKRYKQYEIHRHLQVVFQNGN